jgi:hypothetical protein
LGISVAEWIMAWMRWLTDSGEPGTDVSSAITGENRTQRTSARIDV